MSPAAATIMTAPTTGNVPQPGLNDSTMSSIVPFGVSDDEQGRQLQAHASNQADLANWGHSTTDNSILMTSQSTGGSFTHSGDPRQTSTSSTTSRTVHSQSGIGHNKSHSTVLPKINEEQLPTSSFEHADEPKAPDAMTSPGLSAIEPKSLQTPLQAATSQRARALVELRPLRRHVAPGDGGSERACPRDGSLLGR